MDKRTKIPNAPVSSDEKKKGVIRLSVNAAIIAGIFSAFISILMLFNYFQLSRHNPVESETLKVLVEQLKDEPNNKQLLQEIRAFDLMARKAYFTSKWQIETGAVLLLLGGIVIIIALRGYYKLKSTITEPEASTVDENTRRILSSYWVLGIGALVIVSALVASFFSVDSLSRYETGQTASVNEQPREDSVEVVDLTQQAEVSTPAEKADSLSSGQIANTPEQEEGATKTEKDAVGNEKIAITQKTETPKSAQKNFPGIAEIKKQSPGFRGPLGEGVSFSKNIPSSWNTAAGTNVKWKAKIPKKGFSSPVIWGNKLFVTGADAAERCLYCYDRNSGKLLWQHQANNIAGSPSTPPKTSSDTGLAAPSAATDGNCVTAIFGTGDIIACDMNGNRLWAKNLGVPDNHYGHSSSLIIWKDKVIIQYDTNKGGRLIALNTVTGDIIWETKRSSHISWASPIVADVGGKTQIVTSAEPTVAGYDVETGKELWKNDCMMGEVGPSPGFGNGLAYVGNEYATMAAIDPTTGKTVWEESDFLPEVASPVVADGLLFVATSYGALVCYDAHSGNQYWEQDFNDGFYSSPVVADGNLFAIDMAGNVHIVKVDRAFQKIADNAMGEKIMTTPAFCDGCIYIRGVDNLYCIGK